MDAFVTRNESQYASQLRRRERPTQSIRNGTRDRASDQEAQSLSPVQSSPPESQDLESQYPESQEGDGWQDAAGFDNYSCPESQLPSSSPEIPSASSTGSKRKRITLRTSWIFRHMPDDDPETIYYSRDDYGHQRPENKVWKCKYCPQHESKTYKLVGGTRTAAKHLVYDHGIVDGKICSFKLVS